MDIQENLDHKKEIYQLLLSILDLVDEKEEEFPKFNEIVGNNKYDLKEFLYLISNVSENHHRTTSFFHKIEQIILIFKESIQQYYSNSEIFEIFKNSKRILLFLINEQIFKIDEAICNKMKDYHHEKAKYLQYF